MLTILLRDDDGCRRLYAACFIAAGTVIFAFDRNFVTTPGRHHLRIDEGVFQASLHADAHENFVNHSCDPNAGIGWGDLTLIARKDIAANEEITYDYLTSDLDEADDCFVCNCGSPNCRDVIRGFRNLPTDEQLRLAADVSPYLARFLSCRTQG
jgi:hypothetical protein